ncbi:glycosyltransferase [Halovenus halobia]|uniref:glycosyltransferase n=1 Tax=Halovenus halobia TaxID=3396622 RepID=UPI003F56D5C4
MHITYVYFTAFDSKQAHANQIIHTCNALAETGHRVTLISVGDPLAYADSHNLSVQFELRCVPAQVGQVTVDRILYYLLSLASSVGSDVIFTRDISFLRPARRIPRAVRPPIVYEAHKVYSKIEELSVETEQSRLRSTDAVVAISEGVETDLADIGIQIQAVVPDAASLTQVSASSKQELREKFGIDADAEVILYAGSLSTWKNELELLIESFEEVADSRPDAHLLIVGGGDQRKSLLDHAAEVGAPMDRVTFTGHVPQTTVFEYLGAADVGVVPLTDNDPIAARYTSPLKLYEYLVSNLRIVASAVPAIESATADIDAIFLYTPGDRAEMTEQLLAAVNASEPSHDPKLFSYETRAARLESVLESVLSQG